MTDEPWGRVIRDGFVLLFIAAVFVAITGVS